jgi:hypothetical protein
MIVLNDGVICGRHLATQTIFFNKKSDIQTRQTRSTRRCVLADSEISDNPSAKKIKNQPPKKWLYFKKIKVFTISESSYMCQVN